MSSAVWAPTRRGSRWVPPPPGRMPIRTSGRPTLAEGDGNAIVARHGVLQTAAEGVAVDRGDHRFGAGVEHVVGALADGRALAVGAEAADVSPGDEAAAVTHQHHGLDGGVGVGFVQGVDDALRHAWTQRVDGWVVDDDDADGAVLFQADDLGV